MPSEWTNTDLDVRAECMAEAHAHKIRVARANRRPLWFLYVHNTGAQLRVTWFSPSGDVYSAAEDL